MNTALEKVSFQAVLDGHKQGRMGAISEILNADGSGLSNKTAAVMGDPDSHVGYRAAGTGSQGTGDDGGGVGRIMALEKIDTGTVGPTRARRVGKLNIGTGMSKGFCPTSHIAAVVKRRAGALRSCYEQRLQVEAELKGKLTVRWTINLDGQVEDVRAVSDTLDDPTTTRCIFRHLYRMRFQMSDGGICVVQWPFVFTPG